MSSAFDQNNFAASSAWLDDVASTWENALPRTSSEGNNVDARWANFSIDNRTSLYHGRHHLDANDPQSPGSGVCLAAAYQQQMIAHHINRISWSFLWPQDATTVAGTAADAKDEISGGGVLHPSSIGSEKSHGRLFHQDVKLTIQERRRLLNRRTLASSRPAELDVGPSFDGHAQHGPNSDWPCSALENRVTSAAEASKSIFANRLAELLCEGSHETSKWSRVLLEHSHDLVYVLSLRGTFLYVSPSSKSILGYRPSEMLGKNVGEICHPSDASLVLHQLKSSARAANMDAASQRNSENVAGPLVSTASGETTTPDVNLSMRMKHKTLAFVWIESIGNIHVEKERGRKYFVLYGRRQSIPLILQELGPQLLERPGPGFWCKASKSGIILRTFGHPHEVVNGHSSSLYQQDVSLVGKHYKDLVKGHSWSALHLALNDTHISQVAHSLINSTDGRSYTVYSTIFPQSVDGQRMPSVYVYTQRANAGVIFGGKAEETSFSAERKRKVMLPDETTALTASVLPIRHSGVWSFEMHQLRRANQRLSKELQGRHGSYAEKLR